ncbi:MAG: hypothetical protein O4965_04505 [Trichodesmium sp. St19_bin1]|nr:hypothetical protein [Trichodesmium sp. St19_bin1]
MLLLLLYLLRPMGGLLYAIIIVIIFVATYERIAILVQKSMATAELQK